MFRVRLNAAPLLVAVCAILHSGRAGSGALDSDVAGPSIGESGAAHEEDSGATAIAQQDIASDSSGSGQSAMEAPTGETPPGESIAAAEPEATAVIPEAGPEPEPAPKQEDAAQMTRQQGASAPTVRYLSADDSNSMASPVVARQIIRSGRWIPPDVIRTYEFLNYYDFSYAPPIEGELIALYAHMRAIDDETKSLQVAIAPWMSCHH